MSETTKKTIPIQDVGMFLWRFLFTPLVIAFSFIASIFMCCLMLLLFVLSEVVSFLVAFVVSVCGPRWMINKWAKTVYNFFRSTGSDYWPDEGYLNIPTKWWKCITEPGVRKELSRSAAILSAIVFWAEWFFALGFWLRAQYQGLGPLPNGVVGSFLFFGFLGPLLLWLGLWLLKKLMELLVRWIFQRPRPKPQSQSAASTS